MADQAPFESIGYASSSPTQQVKQRAGTSRAESYETLHNLAKDVAERIPQTKVEERPSVKVDLIKVRKEVTDKKQAATTIESLQQNPTEKPFARAIQMATERVKPEFARVQRVVKGEKVTLTQDTKNLTDDEITHIVAHQGLMDRLIGVADTMFHKLVSAPKAITMDVLSSPEGEDAFMLATQRNTLHDETSGEFRNQGSNALG